MMKDIPYEQILVVVIVLILAVVGFMVASSGNERANPQALLTLESLLNQWVEQEQSDTNFSFSSSAPTVPTMQSVLDDALAKERIPARTHEMLSEQAEIYKKQGYSIRWIKGDATFTNVDAGTAEPEPAEPSNTKLAW